MTTEEIIIDLQLNGDQSSKSLNQLEQDLVNLKSALKNVAVGSDEFKKLQAEVIKADSKVKNLNKSIEGLDTEAMAGEIGKFGGGITATFTAVAAVIGSGNEEFEQFTKNIVTGIAVAQGIKGATEAWTSAQRLLNAAMAANPIGLIVAGVAALTVALIALVNGMDDYSETSKKIIKSQKELKDKYNQTEGEILKLKIQLANLNKEYEKSIKLENQLLQKEKAEEYEKILEEIKQRYIEMGDEAGEGGDKIKEALEEEIKLSGEVIQLQKERDKWYNFLKTKFNILGFNDALDEEIKAAEVQVKNVKQRNKKLLTETDQFKKEEGGLNEKYSLKEKINNAKNNKEKLDREKEINKKILEEREKFLEKLIEAEKKYQDILKDSKNELIGFEEEFALQLIRLNKEVYDKELELLLENNRIQQEQRERARNEKIKEIDAEITELINGQKTLNAKEIELLNKLIAEKKEINANFLANNLASITVNDAKVLELQVNREKAYIESLKTIKDENARNSILLIDDVRKRNLKIIELEAGLAGDIIIKEVQKNEKIIAAGNKRLEQLKELIQKDEESVTSITEKLKVAEKEGNIAKEILDTYRYGLEILMNNLQAAEAEEESVNKQLQTVQETNNALAEKLRLVGETAAKAKEEAKNNNASLQALITINERRKRLVEGQWARERDLTVENLALNTQLQLDALKTQYEQGLIVAEEYEMAKKDIEDEFRKEKTKADIAGYKKAMDMGKQLFADFQAIQLNLTTDRINKELRAREAALEQEVRALDGAVEAGIMSEDAKKDALNKIDFERQKAQRKAAHDQAKAEKEQALIKIAIDTATAIVEAAPVIPLQIQAAILGASQAAVIQSQPLPQLKRGGRIKGPSHENGGVPLYKNGKAIAEVEGDELIMTRGVSQSPMLLAAASQINQLAGGVSFNNQSLGSTAVATMPQQQVNVAAIVQETVRGISSIPVTNVSTDTDRVTRKVRNIEARSRF